MAAYFFRLCHHLDQLVREILRMGCHKTNAPDALDFFHLAQKRRKTHRLRQIFSVGIDVLPQQHDLHNAILCQPLDLADNVARLSAALPPAHIRHDTVAAKIIAAEHDVHAGFEAVFSPERQILHDLPRILPDVDHHILFGHRAPDKLRKFIKIVRPEHQIDKAVLLPQPFYHVRLLHHAAAQRDHHARMLFLIMPELSKPAVYLVVRVLAHRTRIVEDKIRLLALRGHIPYRIQYAAQLFGVAGIHLTAHIDDARRRKTTFFLRKCPHPFPAFRHEIIFPFRLLYRRFQSCLYVIQINFLIHTSDFFPF